MTSGGEERLELRFEVAGSDVVVASRTAESVARTGGARLHIRVSDGGAARDDAGPVTVAVYRDNQRLDPRNPDDRRLMQERLGQFNDVAQAIAWLWAFYETVAAQDPSVAPVGRSRCSAFSWTS